MSASGRSTAKMGDTHTKGDHVNTRSRGSVTTKDNPENESVANLIRSIMDEKLDPIKNSISLLSDSINDALESAKAASTMATEAKTIATQSCDIANEAKSIAAEAQVSASGAFAAAVEAKSIASTQVAELKTQLARCRNEQEVLSEKFLSLEAYSRRNNLGFDGIAETDEQKIHQLFADMKLDPNIQLTACHRFGPHTQKKNIHRSIMVKFLKYSDRNAVWRARSVLHGQNIYVKEDFPAEIEKRRQILRPYLRAAFQGGDPSNPNGRVSAYLKHDSLIVNNQAFKCNMTDSLPEYIQHRVQNPPAEIETDKVFLFFTHNSEFSNFYPSDIDIDGTIFNCAEQYVSYSKAKLFEESQEFLDEIMAMYDPREMKQKVKRLSKYDGQSGYSKRRQSYKRR